MTALSTPLSARMGLATPIIQAPMAGGPSSQDLVAACSAAGALGSFGFAYTQPDEMKRQCAWVRAKTDRPFGINLFTSAQPGRSTPRPSAARSRRWRATTGNSACRRRTR